MSAFEKEPEFSPFDSAVQFYSVPKPQNDPDLVKEVRDILLDCGVSEENLAASYDKNRWIKDATIRNSVVQRTQINQFLTLVLITSPGTIQLRGQLCVNSSLDDWIKLIKKKVAPFIVEKGLMIV